MTTFKQWAANRGNAHKSTGPKTEEGKCRARRNALRHGLTAETVIEGLEDSEDYRAFEATIIADYDAQTASPATRGRLPMAIAALCALFTFVGIAGEDDLDASDFRQRKRRPSQPARFREIVESVGPCRFGDRNHGRTP